MKIAWIRRLFQLSCFILFNAGIWNLGPWEIIIPALVSMHGNTKTITGSLDLLQYTLSRDVMPWTAIASVLLFAVFTGRFACGWICPFGFIQDILSVATKKKNQISPRTNRSLVKGKYVVLLVVLLISLGLFVVSKVNEESGIRYREAFGTFSEGPFNSVSPASSTFVLIPQLPQRWLKISEDYDFTNLATLEGTQEFFATFFTPLFGVRLAVLLTALIGSAYIARFWCRYLCPQGAFLALFSRYSLIGIRREPTKCTKCRKCIQVCPTEVDILEGWWEKITDPECITCLDCIDSCEYNALRLIVG
jgi:polyferredoxin